MGLSWPVRLSESWMLSWAITVRKKFHQESASPGETFLRRMGDRCATGVLFSGKSLQPFAIGCLGGSCRITWLFADFRPKSRTRLAIPTDSLGVFGDRVWRRLTNRIQSSQLPVRAAVFRNTTPSVRQDKRLYGSRYTRDFPCIGNRLLRNSGKSGTHLPSSF